MSVLVSFIGIFVTVVNLLVWHLQGLKNLDDAIANDEKLVQAIIANDDRLNKEVGELFDMDSLLRDDDDASDDEIDHDEIADCLMGCLL
mgnify:CR=1 FL=1